MRLKNVLPLVLLTALTAVPTAAETLGPIDERLLGVWRQVEPATDAEIRVEITREHYSQATGDKLEWRAPVIGQREDGVLVVSLFCNRLDHTVVLDGDSLTVTMTPAKTVFRPEPETKTTRYLRLAERPDVFDLKPLPLGDPQKPIAPERLAELHTDLEERGKRDQEVRQVFTKPGGVTKEDQERVREVDTDNVAFLKDLLAETGWIDAGRFGKEASKAAWLIVQHSGDLSLMTAVLPLVEREVEATGENGGSFALLYDRTQLRLGRKQRYGSQIFYGPDGMFVAPVEDPENVDALRAELGMEPLDDYKKRFQERNGGRPLPVRTEF